MMWDSHDGNQCPCEKKVETGNILPLFQKWEKSMVSQEALRPVVLLEKPKLRWTGLAS